MPAKGNLLTYVGMEISLVRTYSLNRRAIGYEFMVGRPANTPFLSLHPLHDGMQSTLTKSLCCIGAGWGQDDQHWIAEH